MKINFAQLERDFYGRLEDPVLILEKPHGEIIGPLGMYYELKMTLKYNEPSIVTFQYPKTNNGVKTPFYDQIVKDKIIRIEPFGVFIVAGTDVTDDGVKACKEVTLYSREYELGHKKIVYSAGTYNFWNPADAANTLLGMVIEAAPNWHVGYISPALIGRYRTFEGIDEFVLSHLSNIQEKYGCAIIYDSINRTINAYDTSERATIVPVYLSHENLIKEGSIDELEENIVTQLWVLGADGIDIRGVNPTGENYIYNLDYYINNGDIPNALAQKWRSWQNVVFAQQPYYISLVVILNTKIAQKATESAKLTDLQNSLRVLENTRSANIQAQQGYEQGSTAWNNCQTMIDEDNTQIEAKQREITAQQSVVNQLEADITAQNSLITAVNNELKLSAYFTDDELLVLDHYFKHGTFEDSSFAVFDVSTTSDTAFKTSASMTLQLKDVKWVEVECAGEHKLSAISQGTLTINGSDYSLNGNIVSGTLDHGDNKLICSFHLNSGKVDNTDFTGGNFTCSATATYNDSDILAGMTQQSDTQTSADGSVSHTTHYYTGDASLPITNASLYFTSNVTEYQKFSVKQELYNYAVECHKDLASPTYEFEIDSVNFVADPNFDSFKDNIQLGSACYLQLDKGTLLTPILIEVQLNFEDKSDFKLVFSNQFKRADDLTKMNQTLKEVSSTARNFDVNKYLNIEYNNTATFVHDLLQNGFDTAIAQINAGRDNMVTINEMGICVDSPDGTTKIHLNNGMIALVDKESNTAKMAMGQFLNTATNTNFVGILADVIGGTLLAGKNLVIECPGEDGDVMQFKVDSEGVVVNNGRWHMKSNQGCVAIDPNYGFMAGTSSLFSLSDSGKISPTCVDGDGDLILDQDGFPKDINVWIGIDGTVYLRGTVYADAGYFNGVVQATDFLDKKGNSMMTAAGKINSGYLDLMGLEIKNRAGQVVLKITEDGIEFMSSGEEDDTGVSTNVLDTRLTNIETVVGGWKYEGGTEINGEMIATGTVTASVLQGGEIHVLGNSMRYAGVISVEDAYSGDYAIDITSHGALALMAEKGDVYIESQGKFVGIDGADTGDVTVNTNFRPTNANCDLGINQTYGKWRNIYAQTSTISTSDKTKKKDISYELQKMDKFFDELQPCSYKLIDGQSGRTHIGFIAQDIEQSLYDCDMTGTDFAGFVKSVDNEAGDISYGLRYSEFVALNTWQIQQMKAKIAELEAKIESLTKEVG